MSEYPYVSMFAEKGREGKISPTDYFIAHIYFSSLLFVLGDWMVSDSSINIHGNMAAETDAWRLRYKRIEGEATMSGTSSE